MFVNQLIYLLLRDKSISQNTASTERTHTKQIKNTQNSFSHYIKDKDCRPNSKHDPHHNYISLPIHAENSSASKFCMPPFQFGLHFQPAAGCNSVAQEHRTISLKLQFSEKHTAIYFLLLSVFVQPCNLRGSPPRREIRCHEDTVKSKDHLNLTLPFG